METYGILFALGALVCWGIGDFLIQRSARESGVVPALFFNTLVAVFVLLPFVWRDLLNIDLDGKGWFYLLGSGLIMLLASLVDFTAMKRGKLAIIDPIIGFELPLTVILGVVLAKENISLSQYLLIIVIFLGLLLAVTKEKITRSHFEKGALMAVVAAVAMALANFFVGRSSQESSALLTIWYLNGFIFLALFIWLLASRQLPHSVVMIKRHLQLNISQALIDNSAWVFYALAATLIPISIAIAISEGYIALAMILGVFINKEKLKKHQLSGAVLAVVGILFLSYLTA